MFALFENIWYVILENVYIDHTVYPGIAWKYRYITCKPYSPTLAGPTASAEWTFGSLVSTDPPLARP